MLKMDGPPEITFTPINPLTQKPYEGTTITIVYVDANEILELRRQCSTVGAHLRLETDTTKLAELIALRAITGWTKVADEHGQTAECNDANKAKVPKKMPHIMDQIYGRLDILIPVSAPTPKAKTEATPDNGDERSQEAAAPVGPTPT